MKADTPIIMLADDDEAIVDATMLMLEITGYEVIHTIEGSAVPQLAVERQPDLIMLDIWMSGIDGRDICREIKANPATRHIPVLMISASREVGQSVVEAGAEGFIEKPFDMGVVLGKVEELIK